MNRTAMLVFFLILLIGGIWLVQTYHPTGPATLIVLSPTGDETWESGSQHTIAWQSGNVPPTRNVSVTIRRIPPPPLQEEGQEFDPIIFTDLPNSGSATWKISPMYPDGTYVLGVHAYESVPVTNEVSAESAPFSIVHPALSGALYSLWSGASWDGTVVEDVTIGTTTFSGASITSFPVEDTMNPSAIFSPFESYYAAKLRNAGWKIENSVAAGGHVGGQTGYAKGQELLLVRFNVKYKNVPQNAPSECPCDVTLSLFSAPDAR